jgi:hypothetical protein
VWAEGRPADPAVEAKVIDTYVRNGVYAINEARDLLGLDPVPGGDRPMVYGTQGAVPLAQGGGKLAATHLRKYNPDWESEPRVPAHHHGAGEWTTSGGNGEVEIAAGGRGCDGYPRGGCQSGGSYGTSPKYLIDGLKLCRQCAVKALGIGTLPAGPQTRALEEYDDLPE